LSREGHTQQEIAQRLGIGQSTVSRRLAKIKKDFPELLEP
jgi:DNA-directed RNA polymerase specialized sigma subunit